ncbi:MAG: helix-turn-helix domain-containing protein [Oscillospiraceae bacterium]|nr:helix-turn-helix domain-containing protein [Oscillospiraceae bacterium]
MSVSESIKRGLEEMLRHAEGKIELNSHYVAATPPKKYTADEIRRIRDNLNMSQGFFADVIGVSKKTVESWEYGRGRPSGAAARVLFIAESDPEALRRYGFAEW